MEASDTRFGVEEAIRQLFDTSQHSDLEIHCRGMVFKVHKAILACQGGFFGVAMNKNFEEGNSGIIKLEEDDQDIIRAMLQYLYGIDYVVPEGNAPAVFHARVYSTAEFYQLPKLKKICLANFKAIALANAAEGAKSAFNAAQAIYSGTPETDRGLREVLVQATNLYIKQVIDEDEGNQLILKSVPDLAYDLVRIRASKGFSEDGKTLNCACPDCNWIFLHSTQPVPDRKGFRKNGGKTSPKKPEYITCKYCGSSFTIEEYVDYHQLTH